jgi:YD repeat-containing protein
MKEISQKHPIRVPHSRQNRRAVWCLVALLSAAGSPRAATVNYTYDALGQVTQVSYANNNRIIYTYDAVGNWLTFTVIVTNQTLPVAGFTAAPTTGLRPLTVYFTNLSTGATSYSWNFGDRNTATNQNPVKTYTNAGVCTLSLTAAGPGGSSSVTNQNYIVATNPPRPMISRAIPGAGKSNAVITWGSLSTVTYQVQYKNSLSTSTWSLLGTVVASSSSTSITDTNKPLPPVRFYRVVAP